MLQQIAAVIFSLSVANLLHYSHRLGSSSEWVCLNKMDLWISNLRAQHVHWAVIVTTLYFFSFYLFIFLMKITKYKVKHDKLREQKLKTD